MCDCCDENLQFKIKLAIFLATVTDGTLRRYRDSVAAQKCLNVRSQNAIVRMVDKLLEVEPALEHLSQIAKQELKEMNNAENN